MPRVLSERDQRLLILSGLVTAGVLVAALFHFVQGFVLERPWPYNTYLFNPTDRFNDLLHSIDAASTRDPYFQSPSGSVSTYFPFTYLVLLPLAQLPPAFAVAVFVVTSVGALIALIAWWSRSTKPGESARRGLPIAGVIFLAGLYPLHFALDRGNLDAWVAPMCLAFVLAVQKRHPWLAVCLLAAAVAMKGFPAAFLLLLVVDRRYLQTLMSLALALGLTAVSALSLAGGIARTVAGVQHGMATFQAEYVIKNGSLHYSTDLFNALKLVSKFGSMHGWWSYDSAAMLLPYHAVVLAIAALIVFFVLFVSTSTWRRMYAICLLVLVFPDVANDYKLLMLLPGVLCLVDEPGEARNARSVLVLTALLLTPKHYVFLIHDISISCVINPILVLLLLWRVLADRPAWRASVILAPRQLRWYLHLVPGPAPIEGA